MADLYAEIEELNERNDYFGIVGRLMDAPRDLKLSLQYVRALINASQMTDDSYELHRKAEDELEAVHKEAEGLAQWHFYKGYLRYLQGRFMESLICFEQAFKCVDVERDDAALLSNINRMLQMCRSKLMEIEYPGVSADDRGILMHHIHEHFGECVKLCTLYKVEVQRVLPTPAHPYHLLVTCGLSGKKLNVPQGYDTMANAHLELCLPLPERYEFTADRDANWPVYMLLDLIEMVISTRDFVGFGYCVENGKPFSKVAPFNAVMFSGLGEYPGESQSVELSDKSLTHFYQLLPLMPLETAFRRRHSAIELLDEFKNSRVMLTPFYEDRPDIFVKPPQRGV
ncbi:MAG: suppressor of fused domain protein [Succinivibrio sp.]|nr:suppressor of fused domain protein [Succinivibrio sp.]